MSIFKMTKLQESQMAGTSNAGDDASVFIEYYTDPLCSWSWAFEAPWRALRYTCAGRLTWRYRMGGMLSDWRSYHDPFNDISNPSQMAPQWLQVQELSGMPFDELVWHIDPPNSSYPACLAVKAAQRQGDAAAEQYLRRLREAVMLERRNIARPDILLTIAQETAQAGSMEEPFDFNRFRDDLDAQETREAFRNDLRDASYYGIGRFPTLVLHRTDGRGIVLVGYRPHHVLWTALHALVPAMHQTPAIPQEQLALEYISRWQRVTARELVEVCDCTVDQISPLLASLVSKGMIGVTVNISSRISLYTPSTQRRDSTKEED